MPTTWWEVLNSQLVITLLTVLLGSLVLAWLTALWQRRAQAHNLKLDHARNMLSTYHEYIRVIKAESPQEHAAEFDSVHSRMIGLVKITEVLFKDRHIRETWMFVVSGLANARNLRLRGDDESATAQLDRTYEMAAVATEMMFKELH